MKEKECMKEKYAAFIGKTFTAKDLDSAYSLYSSMSCKPSAKRYPENYVLDEDKTVRWNREQVKKHNDAVEEEVKRLNSEKNAKREELYNLYRYVIHEALNWKFTDHDVNEMMMFWKMRFDSHEHNSRSFYDLMMLECNRIKTMDVYKSMKSRKDW